ncbi:hypothetical protein Ancab_033780 [Ancistrocladus abbreviatus]
MGCCVSTQSGTNHHRQPQVSTLTKPLQYNDKNSTFAISKSPPRAEEETVKEVLSETPKPRSQSPKISSFNGGGGERKLSTPKRQTLEMPKREIKSLEAPLLHTVTISTPEELSEASEICSLSESLSTTTISEKREREDHPSKPPELYQVRKKVIRSPARPPRNGLFTGDSGLKRENATGRSPVRRSDQSPRRRSEHTVIPGSCRDPGQGMVKRGSGLDGQRRRDPGRGSRSPGSRIEGSGAGRANLGRNPSGRKTGPSPKRVGMVPPPPRHPAVESRRKAVEEEQGRREINKWSTLPNESLENPLVSLECFIFL